MNRTLGIALLFVSVRALAQVEVDRPILLTAPVISERQVIGLVDPVEETDVIRTGAAQQGMAHWATVGGSATAIQLTMDAPPPQYRNGELLRFMPNASASGMVTVSVNGLAAVPVVRNDRLPVAAGEIEAGRMVEIEFRDSVFVLLGRADEGCPTGFLSANDRLCMQQNENPARNFFDAASYCLERGARLCSWDDHYYACTVLNGQLTGVFDDWEWIDDTSDHTHTADQVGRYSCMSQRSIGALVTETANFRCCYWKK